MKKFGINNDVKKLKSFKVCLQSRSQETLNPPEKKGDDIPPEDEEHNGDFDTLYQNPSKNTTTLQSEFTTLERPGKQKKVP